MPKLKKGHNFGFKAGNVPHYKGTIDEMGKFVPYIRLSNQMFNMVSETRSTAEREEFYVRAALVLPSPLAHEANGKSIPKSLNDDESEQ